MEDFLYVGLNILGLESIFSSSLQILQSAFFKHLTCYILQVFHLTRFIKRDLRNLFFFSL